MIAILTVVAVIFLATQIYRRQYFASSTVFWAPAIAALIVSNVVYFHGIQTSGNLLRSLSVNVSGFIISCALAAILFFPLRKINRISPMKIANERKAWVSIFFSLLIAVGATFSLSAGDVVCSDAKCHRWIDLFGGDAAYSNLYVSLLLFNFSTFGPLCSAATMISRTFKGGDGACS